MDNAKKAMELHRRLSGKIEITPRYKITSKDDLALAYTPGVAEPCKAIAENYEESFKLTRRGNMVAVITDGSAVLGLGNIGPAAAMPVMEGKCVLFKEFAGVDAFPICIDSNDTDKIVETVALIAKSFGGINLEDIAAPRCFEIEARLKKLCDIPVFHDDQHGTAVVVAAALLNAAKVLGKQKGELKIVINGAGAAGIAIGRLLLGMEFGEIIFVDRMGIVCQGDPTLNPAQAEMSLLTNPRGLTGSLEQALEGADVFIGVSAPGVLSEKAVVGMNNGIVFALANPVPEIMPDQALRAGAALVGTGRSDFPNQINNVLVFPGIFKGALAAGAADISESMKYAAAYALASMIPAGELSAENILPSALDKSVADVIAAAVAEDAQKTGNIRKNKNTR